VLRRASFAAIRAVAIAGTAPASSIPVRGPRCWSTRPSSGPQRCRYPDIRGTAGQAQDGDGPYVFIAEVPEDRPPQVQIVLKVPDADAFRPDPAVGVVTPFEDTHYGTREMTVRDPDGRLWSLQARAKK
jgi:hypothetical protein